MNFHLNDVLRSCTTNGAVLWRLLHPVDQLRPGHLPLPHQLQPLQHPLQPILAHLRRVRLDLPLRHQRRRLAHEVHRVPEILLLPFLQVPVPEERLPEEQVRQRRLRLDVGPGGFFREDGVVFSARGGGEGLRADGRAGRQGDGVPDEFEAVVGVFADLAAAVRVVVVEGGDGAAVFDEGEVAGGADGDGGVAGPAASSRSVQPTFDKYEEEGVSLQLRELNRQRPSRHASTVDQDRHRLLDRCLRPRKPQRHIHPLTHRHQPQRQRRRLLRTQIPRDPVRQVPLGDDILGKRALLRPVRIIPHGGPVDQVALLQVLGHPAGDLLDDAGVVPPHQGPLGRAVVDRFPVRRVQRHGDGLDEDVAVAEPGDGAVPDEAGHAGADHDDGFLG